MRIIWLIAALVSAPALAADQFDLICKSNDQSERYRIDLVASEWCFGKCEVVQKINEVTSGLIILEKHDPISVNDRRSFNRINRLTGEWQWYNYSPQYYPAMDVKGVCEPAAFSGIAGQKVKF